MGGEWAIRRTIARGISTKEVDDVFSSPGFRRRVSGAKLCGAGGGGVGFGVLPGAGVDHNVHLSPHIGLGLTELGLSETEAGERIAAIDEVFLEHGADRALYGVNQERINWWLDRVSWVRHRTAKGDWDITLVPAGTRHMGDALAHP